MSLLLLHIAYNPLKNRHAESQFSVLGGAGWLGPGESANWPSARLALACAFRVDPLARLRSAAPEDLRWHSAGADGSIL
jgi:hypothetical protein